MKYEKVAYEKLNAKQKERFNFQKVSAVLADYGFITMALSDDWNGADFLAIHKDGDILKIQLKGRMTLDKKYVGKDLFICFRNGTEWYIYPHDLILDALLKDGRLTGTDSWEKDGLFSFPNISAQNATLLQPFRYAA